MTDVEDVSLRSRRNLIRQIESDVERDEDKNKTPAEIIQDVLNCIQNRSEEPGIRIDKLNGLVRLIKNHERLKYTYPAEPFLKGLRFCISDSVKEVRIAGYRTLRYLIADSSTLDKIINLHYEVFIIRSLAKDPRSFNDEREQVLKLIRAFSDVLDGTKYISFGIIRSIVSIAEQSDDKLRNICLETLAELLLRDPKLVTYCGGMRVLLQALVDGPLDIVEYLIMALLYVIDLPDSRECIRPGVDLEIVLSGFTDACNKGQKYEQQIKASSRAIAVLLKSWTGIIFFCMNDKQAIKSIVGSLRITTDETREIMLDMFFDIFRIKTPSWYNNFLTGKRITVFGNSMFEDKNRNESQPIISRTQDRHNLLEHHLVILLDIFIDCGLLEVLVEIIEDKNQHIARKATLFIGELLQLSNRLLSVSRSIRIQSLPGLFKLATKFDDEIVRHSATAALSHIDNLNRTRSRLQSSGIDEHNRASTPRKRQVRQVENVKLKMGIQIEDGQFRAMLLDSQILASKDFTKWNLEIAMELLQGPLLNPKRLEEVIRIKFIKQLISFFRPNKRRFSEVEKSPENERYTQLGCTLITTLLTNPDGVKFLEGNKFLRQIADGLNQLDPINGSFEAEPFFSKERLNVTLTSGYFKMLGVLSKFRDGVKLLEKFKIFNTFYHLSELKSREDLIKAIITNLDYSLDGHPRILLSKVMTSGYKRVRLYATKHLGVILRTSAKMFNEWGIPLLITQLYDPAMEVCQMAVRVLEETCNHKENIELLVKLRPSLDHLGEIGNPLLLRFLSTSIGFKYLYEFDYVEKEMDEWFQGNIGSSKSGLQFLEEENIITNIKCIAENSSVLSLKGFTASGVEILEELEWESVYDPDTGVGTGLCIPMNSQAFLSFPKWNYKGFYNPADKLIKPLSSSNNQIERDLLKAMSNLTNRILSSTGSRALAKRLVVDLFDVDFSPEALDQLDKLFTRTHRGSDGVIAIMSEDQNDTFAEEIVPKQDLLPKIIVKGFNL
ncbi:9203_t:CDS:10 [Entrophospora sp. SA101]|nr:9203_t:CDS:10 [Entrophospora sp. SA101]